jgi:chromosome segregation ATPase
MDSPPDKLIKALEAHVETLKAQLAAAEARIDKQADDLVAYDAAYAAGLAAERAKVEAERARADKAIAAFASLAERLDALAAERRRRGWWRRLVG